MKELRIEDKLKIQNTLHKSILPIRFFQIYLSQKTAIRLDDATRRPREDSMHQSGPFIVHFHWERRYFRFSDLKTPNSTPPLPGTLLSPFNCPADCRACPGLFPPTYPPLLKFDLIPVGIIRPSLMEIALAFVSFYKEKEPYHFLLAIFAVNKQKKG